MLQLAFIALVALQLRDVAAWALPWLATEYIEVHVSTLVTAGYDTYYSSTRAEYVETNIIVVIPTVSTFPALSVVTTTGYTDLTLVEILVPTGVGTSIDRYPSYTTGNWLQLVYTAPDRCDPRWVWTTSASVYVPYQVILTPTSVYTTASVPTVFGATTTQYFGYIDPTDIPESSFSSISSYYEPYFVSSCTIPSYYLSSTTVGTATATSPKYSAGTGDSDSSSRSYYDCDPFIWSFSGIEIGGGYYCDDGTYYTHGMSITNFVLIWLFTWFGVFFILGLIESYVIFAKLSQGKEARRGMPCLFACLAPLLSCLCLCFRKSGYLARPADEQAVLKAQWKSTPFGTKLARWIKWGFRFKYPPFLGDAPARRGRAGGAPRRVAAAAMAPPQYTRSPSAGDSVVLSTPVAPAVADRHGVEAVSEMQQTGPAHELAIPDGSEQKGAFDNVNRV